MRFTDKAVQALKPTTKRRKFTCDRCQGLQLKLTPAGKKSWYVRRVFEGRRQEIKLGDFPAMDCRQAKTEFHRLTEKVDDGLAKIVQKRRAQKTFKARTIADCCEMLLNDFLRDLLEPQSFEQYEMQIKVIRRSSLEKYPVEHITKARALEAFRAWKDEGLSRSTLKKRFNLMSRAYVYAMEEEVIEPGFDVYRFVNNRRIKPLPTGPRRVRVLSDDEIRFAWHFRGYAGFVDAENPRRNQKAYPMKALECNTILKLLLMTGLRTYEIRDQKWENWEHIIRVKPKGARKAVEVPTYILEKSKTKVPYYVPLLPPVLKVLKEYKAARNSTSPYVFPSLHVDIGTFAGSVRQQMARNGCTHTLHDIRRTVATRLGDLGYEDFDIAKILNHTRKGVTAKHYNHAKYLLPKAEIYAAWLQELHQILSEDAEVFVLPEKSTLSISA
tara:strand:+ start:280 stop:1602 length:1323 start_codon:yes stop_codon:yes gene_type:complete